MSGSMLSGMTLQQQGTLIETGVFNTRSIGFLDLYIACHRVVDFKDGQGIGRGRAPKPLCVCFQLRSAVAAADLMQHSVCWWSVHSPQGWQLLRPQAPCCCDTGMFTQLAAASAPKHHGEPLPGWVKCTLTCTTPHGSEPGLPAQPAQAGKQCLQPGLLVQLMGPQTGQQATERVARHSLA